MTLYRSIAAVALVLVLACSAGHAAEIKVLSIPGVKAAVDELVPQFERDNGHKVIIRYEIFAGQKKEIEAGDFDVAIFAKAQIAEMNSQGRIVLSSAADIARTNIGVVVRKGAPKPEIGDEEAFKRTLLAAKSITYTKESSTGVYITRLLERLGVADAIKDKLKLQSGGGMTTPAVANGDAEIGIVLVSDILATPGVDLVGPLPAGLQNSVTQTGAVGSTAKQPAAAAALLQFLTSAPTGRVYASKGLEPAQ
jgi:molybdate transport system substrate-binding protein